MDTQPYYTKARLKSLKEAADDWVSATGIDWDIAACWHLPLSDIDGGVEQAELHISRKLRLYFNKLDRRVFKAQHKKGFRVRRFITLEHAASVGWHVHGILATPSHVDQRQFITEVQQVWLHCAQHDKIGLPRTNLAWCEAIRDSYARYTTKNSFGATQFARGAIDLHNTFFGEPLN